MSLIFLIALLIKSLFYLGLHISYIISGQMNYMSFVDFPQRGKFTALLVKNPQTIRNNGGGAESKSAATSMLHDNQNDESQKTVIQKLCYSEVKERGSCLKAQCQFSHEVPDFGEEERTRTLNLIGQKNLCINEFRKKGSCIKKERCRFHHDITPEQRTTWQSRKQ